MFNHPYVLLFVRIKYAFIRFVIAFDHGGSVSPCHETQTNFLQRGDITLC